MSDKGAKDWKERAADSMASRRARWDKDQVKDATAEYGADVARGVIGAAGAGKGDKRRVTDQELYEAGYMAAYAETAEARESWARRWQTLHDARRLATEPVEIEKEEKDDTPAMYKRGDTGA